MARRGLLEVRESGEDPIHARTADLTLSPTREGGLLYNFCKIEQFYFELDLKQVCILYLKQKHALSTER